MTPALSALASTCDAIGSAVDHKLFRGRLTPEEIERAAEYADVAALACDVREELGPDAARDPWTFYAYGRPRGYARNLILIYSRACELAGVTPSDVVGWVAAESAQ